MKIVSVGVELIDEGQAVTIRAVFGRSEDLEEADVQRILDAARELAGADRAAGDRARDVGDTGVSRDTDKADAAPRRRRAAQADPVTAGLPPVEIPAELGGRRRRAEPVTEPRQPETTTEETSQGGRRRRGSSDPTPSPSTTDTSPTQEPISTGRRRRSGNPAPIADTSTPQESPVEGGGRRRRSVPTSTPTTAPSQDAPSRRTRSPGAAPASATKSDGAESTGVSDEVLLKACSLTARKCGTDVVKDIVDEFAVGSVDKLPQCDRQDFLDKLADARASADK